LVNSPASDASDDGSQLLAAPPIYNSNVPLPPSYSSHPVQKTSPAGPRQPISGRNTTSSSSSTGAVSADAGGGSRPPSINDSETYVSVDDGSQPYQETVFSSGAHNMTGERDSKAMFSGSVGEMDTTLSDDNGLSPHDSVSAFGSLTASSSSSQEPRYSEDHSFSSCGLPELIVNIDDDFLQSTIRFIQMERPSPRKLPSPRKTLIWGGLPQNESRLLIRLPPSNVTCPSKRIFLITAVQPFSPHYPVLLRWKIMVMYRF